MGILPIALALFSSFNQIPSNEKFEFNNDITIINGSIALSYPTEFIIFNHKLEKVVSINIETGKITLENNVTLDEASKAFYQSFGQLLSANCKTDKVQ